MTKRHKSQGSTRSETLENGDNGDNGGNGGYAKQLRAAQVELVKLQRHVIKNGQKILILFEGRDGSGKDSTIKRLTEHMSPRETRVVALPKPSDREKHSWYFQRYVPHLPASEEIVVFNRSWYNRAGVERVMGFCSTEELRAFFDNVIPFEHMLIDSGIRMLKYYLDIDKAEQKRRLALRREDPLKQWKLSPIDKMAVAKWQDYTDARDEMLARTSVASSPWFVVDANDKKIARLNVIRHILSHIDYHARDKKLPGVDAKIVHPYGED